MIDGVAPDGGARIHGKYAIERRLGGGGMAEVFLARTVGAEGFSRPVALKRVLPGFSDDAEFARMFVSEAQLTSRLQHPNIVSVLDFDRDDRGGLFLVMELVDGVDLDGLLDTSPLCFPLVIHLAIEILSGLRYAHDLPLRPGDVVRGLVHRDISPHNVLLSWEGAVKVSDFGIAKSRSASQATASIFMKGKPAYMSPEQVNGQPLDGRSDLFAVGVMLWQMLCQQPLFSGSTAEETIARLLFTPIAPPHVVRPDVPADLSRVVLGLLDRDVQQRTPDADAAITALLACADHPRNGRELLIETLAERFVGRAPVHGRRVTTASPIDPTRVGAPLPLPRKAALPGPVTLTAARAAATDASARPARSRRRVWPVLVGGALVAALAGGLLWRSRRPRPAVPGAISIDPAERSIPSSPEPMQRTLRIDPADPGSAGGAPATPPPLGDTPRPTIPPALTPRSHRSRPDPGPAGSGSEGIHEIRLGA